MPAIEPLPAPQRVAVIGAGMVGLATAWFLQERGVQVTVLDRTGVAAGASWGNAGWLTPGITTPLPEPAVLRYGLRAVLSPSSPVYVPPRADARLLRFLAGFTRHSTAAKWRTAMHAYIPMNRRAFEAFDALAAGGVEAMTHEAKSFIAAYRTEAERSVLLDELAHIHAAGQEIEFDVLTGAEAREVEPSLSDTVGAAIRLHGQRFINPGEYVHALADSVRARGASLVTGAAVVGLHDEGSGVRVVTTAGADERYDAVVLATGTWLGELGRRFGVKTVVQAGRGYSFSIPIEHVPSGPVYFPAQRVACTPLGDRLRVAGMMEFRSAEAPLDRRRILAIAEAARPLLRGADLDARTDEWVGARPCTPDGLPLIGRTRSPRVFAAGGHGMWGITLGPLTGNLLAEQIITGRQPAELNPFDPLR
ncbi:FAD-binding oxidoreductase [Micromonospora sp. DR5-3]|uniref:NAD(P)/FAD-dependent oxidoreductase n=1 Tax=unclassified Micromonospora TaxID=2617518 RepID=UPI0011DA70E7|nr:MULTISPECIES: FAD-dependent oxidoreductase [unclassified Micromonospora]MCW3818126.1 FAD-binding oxidoreductase [Micromonospora sp. DR5-3]TYC21781.1 FAD-dependent oxidoreductase [Micromonospora sp. MP36]